MLLGSVRRWTENVLLENWLLHCITGCNVFTQEDANLTSDAESEQYEAEECNDSDRITLDNILSLQLKLAEDEEDEECFGLGVAKMECNISEAVATTFQFNRLQSLLWR